MRLGAGEGRHLRHQPILLGSCNSLTRKVTTQPGVRGVSESPCRARRGRDGCSKSGQGWHRRRCVIEPMDRRSRIPLRKRQGTAAGQSDRQLPCRLAEARL